MVSPVRRIYGLSFCTTYAAVKAGISHFGEALRRESKGKGVHVLTVYPGPGQQVYIAQAQACRGSKGPFHPLTRYEGVAHDEYEGYCF